MFNCNQHLNNNSHSLILTIIALTSLAVISSSQTAQAQQNTTPANQTAIITNPPVTNPSADRDPLAGPRISEHAEAPGVTTGFTARGHRRTPNDRARLRLYDKVLSRLDLTPQQHESVKSIHEKLQTETRAYFRKHQEEINQLKTILRSNQPPALPEQTGNPQNKKITNNNTNNKIDTNTDPSPEVRNARKKMRDIIKGKPKANPYLSQVWDILTPDQQTRFRIEAQAIEQEMRERKLGKAGQIDANNPDKRPFIERRREFIKQLLEKESDQLTEQDLKMLERIRRRMERQKIQLENNQPPQPPKASDIPIDSRKDNAEP